MFRNELAVGIIFFIGLTILGYFTIIMKDEFIETRPYRIYQAEFPYVNGIQIGERVKLFGVNVGAVTEINLKERSVVIDFKMYKTPQFYENYSLKIRQEGVMGGRYLAIDPGTPYTKNIQNKTVDISKPLQGDPPTDVLALVEDVVSENRADIRVSVANIREISTSLKSVTAKIDRGEGTIGKLINEDQTKGVKDLVQEVRDTVEDSREQAPITSFIRSILTIL